MFKVVSHINKKYLSHSLCSKTRLEYKIGKWTYPIENSKLFCFENYDDAKEFIWVYGKSESQIFSCSVINPKEGDYMSQDLNCLDIFWRCYNKPSFNQFLYMECPKGTIFCDGIRLEKIYWGV